MYDLDLLNLRKQYHRCFITTLPSGLQVPWRALTLQEYLAYNQDTKRAVVPLEQLEDEIFSLCVLDLSLVRQINTLEAGTVSTVIQNIWQVSGPINSSALVQDLDYARTLINSPDIQILHQFVQLITTAFPYKPEEVYEMDYETLLVRTAQAEKKLMELNVINEPLQITSGEESESKLSPVKERLRKRIDAKKLWEEQQAAKRKEKKPVSSGPTPANVNREKWWEVSPALESEHKFDYARDFVRQSPIVSEDEKLRQQMLKDATWIYKDLIDGLAKKK